MRQVWVPASGRLLSTHLAAYGLALALQANGFTAYLGHDPSSLECDPVLMTDASTEDVAASVLQSALACESAVEADLVPGKTGNDRIPVIRARATDPDRAITALAARESLLDTVETHDSPLAASLVAGLGAPAPWLRDGSPSGKSVPGRGASQLDGLPYNIGSDIVRGLLRPILQATKHSDPAELATLFTNRTATAVERDRTRWSPDGTKLPAPCQWLAALGLGLLPVGMSASGRARTPGFWRRAGTRGITIPVLAYPVSVPRLRSIIQQPELMTFDRPDDGARLRALGVSDMLSFSVVDASSGTMVAFSFTPATRYAL